MADHLIAHDGVEISTSEGGDGTPVVLLHGLTATRRYVVMGSKALERSGRYREMILRIGGFRGL